jgi:peptide/nickel transport system permease protein/peptide/nickel transport system substrate-binding protein
MVEANHGARGVSRRTALLLPVASALSGNALLAQLARAGEEKPGGTLRVASYSNPSRLDPSTGTNGADQAMLWPMFDTLVDIDFATLQPKPKLAESFEFRDPTTLVLNIRKGVVFHDGVALDADAVKFNFTHMMTNPASAVKGEISTLKSVEVEGPMRVVLKLSQPDVSALLNLTDRSGMMSSPKAITERGADYDRNPVGTGQYVFQRWDDANKLVMTRNPNYWQPGQPKLDAIEFRIIPDTNTGLRAVYAGECDLVYRVSPQQIPAIDRAANVVKHVDPGLYTQQLFFNNAKPPMDDVRVRQAINYAIDRVAYTKAIAAGYGQPAYTSVPPGHWAYDEKAASYYPYDPDKAKALLKEAGAEGVELHAFHYSDSRAQQRMEILTQYLSKVGFKLKYTTGSIPVVNKQFNEQPGGHFISSAWTGRADPSVILTSMFMPGGYYNRGDVPPTPELKQAVLDTLAAQDQGKRREAFARALRYERDSALYAPLCFDPEIVVHNPRVKGFVPTLLGKPRFDGISLEAKA